LDKNNMPSIELGSGYIPENKTKKDRVQKEQVTRVSPRPDNPSKSNDIRIKQGNFAWSLLHKYTGCDPQWFELWQYFIPNRCDCQAGYQKILESLPPDFSSPDAFFAWGVQLHNAVNKKLERQEMQIDQANANWRNIRPQSGKTKAIVTVATGREYLDLLEITGPTIKAYADRCRADYIALTNSTKSWWGLEKFRTRHFVEQYEEVLFVDADCIIKKSCPSLFGQDCDLMIHDDAPYLQSLDWLRSERRDVCKAIGIEYDDGNLCLNSGVVYTRKSANSVWTEPPETIPTSHCAEQIVVEQQAIKHGYELLDSRFNWQFYFKNFWDEIDNAHIIHLATCKDKLETAKRILT
jgi:hypothetical protein